LLKHFYVVVACLTLALTRGRLGRRV
jgi:hypothetical protein